MIDFATMYAKKYQQLRDTGYSLTTDMSRPAKNADPLNQSPATRRYGKPRSNFIIAVFFAFKTPTS